MVLGPFMWFRVGALPLPADIEASVLHPALHPKASEGLGFEPPEPLSPINPLQLGARYLLRHKLGSPVVPLLFDVVFLGCLIEVAS